MDPPNPPDPRISLYLTAVEKMLRGDYDLTFPTSPEDETGKLGKALLDLASSLKSQASQAERLAQTSYLGIAAHDLRAPLSFIQTVISLLLSPEGQQYAENREELLDSVGKQVKHMLVLLDNIMDFSEIQSGKLRMSLVEVDLAPFLEEIVRRHNQVAASKGTRIQLQVEQSGKVKADPYRLRQVMDNLISNAVKFSPPGSSILVSAIKRPDGWQLSVRDEGPGISAQDREQLFQPFKRLSARPTGGEKSTGLGLTIASRIVAAHGGRIDVDSSPGEGSTFWFTLPNKTGTSNPI